MARKQTLVQLTDELVEILDRLAARSGSSRSALIRQAIRDLVRSEQEREADARLVEAYTRIPDDGEFNAWAEESTRRMIEEEPW